MIVSHLDLYRLSGPDARDADLLDDYLGPDRLAFIEWPGADDGTFGRVAMRVTIGHLGGDRRRIEIAR